MPSISDDVRDDVTSKRAVFRRFEVISGDRRRRPWTVEEKLAIVAESFSTLTSISEVARRHGLNRNQLFQWRRQFRDGGLGGACVGAFVPVTLAGTVAMAEETVSAAVSDGGLVPAAAAVEVVIGPATVRVSPRADEATVRLVLAVVARLR